MNPKEKEQKHGWYTPNGKKTYVYHHINGGEVHVSTVTNFIILPLSFLSGTFFPITRFPELLHNISYYNPFFYMIDGLRYGFSGQSFGSLFTGIIYVLSINFALWVICYWLVKSGYKLKA